MIYNIVPSSFLKKAAPYALTAVAGAGVVATAVLAAKATPKAIEKKEEAEKEKGEPLTSWEKFKAMAPSYIPSASTALITLSSIGGLAVMNGKRQAEIDALIASTSHIINRAGRRYSMLRDDVMKKDPEIVQDFDRKSFNKEWEEYIKERHEKKAWSWCWNECLPINSSDEWSEERLFGIEYGNGLADENEDETIYFRSTPADVICAFYNLNGEARNDQFASGIVKVNDLFHRLNLPKTQLGELLVWDPIVMEEEWGTDFISFTTKELTYEDDVPNPGSCTMIYFTIPPLAEGYAEGMGMVDGFYPVERLPR